MSEFLHSLDDQTVARVYDEACTDPERFEEAKALLALEMARRGLFLWDWENGATA